MSQTEVGAGTSVTTELTQDPMDIGLVPTFFWGLIRARGQCQSIGIRLDPDG
jgi:hypothetical protein